MHLYWTSARLKMLHPIPTWISQDSASAKLFISIFFLLLPKELLKNYSSNFFPVSWKVIFPEFRLALWHFSSMWRCFLKRGTQSMKFHIKLDTGSRRYHFHNDLAMLEMEKFAIPFPNQKSSTCASNNNLSLQPQEKVGTSKLFSVSLLRIFKVSPNNFFLKNLF